MNNELPWKISKGKLHIASFKYFQEALDYIEYANKRGATVILQSPHELKDTITIYRADGVREEMPKGIL